MPRNPPKKPQQNKDPVCVTPESVRPLTNRKTKGVTPITDFEKEMLRNEREKYC